MLRLEQAAEQVQRTTFTVRVLRLNNPRKDADFGTDVQGKTSKATEATKAVTVCSGVSVGDGLVVTFVQRAPESQVRITVPGGGQASAELRVVDDFCGLSLWETNRPEVPAITLANAPPTVGSMVLGGAGWGAESPVVALGIVSSMRRTVAGASMPQLIQCDLRTTNTSAGGPVVDREGKLVGIIVAEGQESQGGNWCYAVPVVHVQRLISSVVPRKVVQLKRQRPVAGLVLGPGNEPGEVLVQQVREGGPAHTAGIQVGDRIVSADNIQIRSVYQTLRPLWSKQPGDPFQLSIKRGQQLFDLTLTLEGTPNDSSTSIDPFTLVDRRIQITKATYPGGSTPRRSTHQTGANDQVAAADIAQRKIDSLTQNLARNSQLVYELREQIRQRDIQRITTAQEIGLLKAEVEMLRKIVAERLPASEK